MGSKNTEMPVHFLMEVRNVFDDDQVVILPVRGFCVPSVAKKINVSSLSKYVFAMPKKLHHLGRSAGCHQNPISLACRLSR